jgi:hypothetical protein
MGGVELPIAPFLALALDGENGRFHAAAAVVLVKVPPFPLHRTAGMVACPCIESNHDISVVQPLPQPLLWEQNMYPVRPVFAVI